VLFVGKIENHLRQAQGVPGRSFLKIISLSMILKFVQMEEVLSTEACMTSIVDNLPSLTGVSDSQSNYALNMFLVYL